MRVYEVKYDGCNSVCENTLNGVMSILENSDIGDKITIDIREMSEFEYEALPEYLGP